MGLSSRFLLSAVMGLGFASNSALAQTGGGAANLANSPLEIRNASTVILVSGLVGGILGLSTLSFYEEPQNHISNITIGAGIGVICSAIYLTAAAAQQPPAKASLEPGFEFRPGVDAEGRWQLAGLWRF